ncbi:MAG: putative Ig domain-containing protein, partial [Terriglobales bacterium]
MALAKVAGRALLALGMAAGCAAQTSPFQIRTTHLPLPELGKFYRVQLEAAGGTAPYRWTLLTPLPDGLAIDGGQGLISGSITGASISRRTLHPVLVQVEDSAAAPLVETRLLPFGHGAPLAIEWTPPPAVTGAELAGAVQVTNGSDETVRLTVIVMAVNATGKAFALRYDQRDLQADEATPALAFQV